jgi:predicted nucleic acid-binding protein
MGQRAKAQTTGAAPLVIALVDTSIIVDLLRSYPTAEAWLKTQGQLGVSRAVWIEILEGATNRQKQQIALKLLKRFDLVELTTEDIIWATQALMKYGLSHNVDGYDCMIAAASHRLQLPLYNRNMKHFTPLLGAQAVKPY